MENRLKEVMHEKGFTTLREVVIQRRPDWAGDPALFVWLLLDDALTDDDLNYEFIESLRDTAFEEMILWEPDLFPYIHTRRVREWKEMVAL